MLSLVKHVITYRHVVTNFVIRDLKVKYRGTIAGYLWSLLEPLLLVATYYFIFVVLTQRGGDDFALVLILGLLPWTYFAGTVLASTTALRSNAALILRICMPREVFVIANVGTGLVVLSLSMVVVVPFLFVYDVGLGWSLALWPVAVLLITLFAVGIGLIVACANAIYRDVGYVVTVAMRVGLYVSAAIYPVEMVPQEARYLFLFNPMAVCLSMARNAVLNRPMPFETEHLLWTVALAVITCVGGAQVFKRLERTAVKFL